MKRILSLFITLIFTLSVVTGCFAADSSGTNLTLSMEIGNPVMTVNGTESEIDQGRGTAPVIQNGRTLVPIRAIVEAMGGTVNWDGETQTALLEYNGDAITLTIGSNTAYLNENENTLDTAPAVINGRTMLPIRFIAESFGFDVEWDEDTKTITISSQTVSADTPADIQEENSNTGENSDESANVLVVYYSSTGNTEEAANKIASAVNGDIFEIEPADPYTSNDLNWNDENSRVVYEYENPDERDVELVSTAVPDWESYDTVFIGYPIWWGIAAWPVSSFVDANDFTGKTVIPFCTSSSSGIGESGTLLEEAAGTGNWIEGMRFGSRVSEDDISTWVNSILENAEDTDSLEN